MNLIGTKLNSLNRRLKTILVLLNDLFLAFTNNEPTFMLQSIDKKFIISLLILLLLSISKSFGLALNNLNTKEGVITLMYHRFDENKYPSTNIRNEIFIEHLKEINNLGIQFITFKKFEEIIKTGVDRNYSFNVS